MDRKTISKEKKTLIKLDVTNIFYYGYFFLTTNYLLFCLVVSSKLLLGGSDAANKLLLEMVNAFPDHLSIAIQNEKIGDLARFRENFGDDAWLCVTSLGIKITTLII